MYWKGYLAFDFTQYSWIEKISVYLHLDFGIKDEILKSASSILLYDENDVDANRDIVTILENNIL